MKKFTKMSLAAILLLSCGQQFTMDYIKTAGSFLAPAIPNGWSVAALACMAGHIHATNEAAYKINTGNIPAYNSEQTDNFYDSNLQRIQTFKRSVPIASMALTVALPYFFPQLQKYRNLGSKITIGTSIAALAMTYGQLQYQKWQNKKKYEKYPEFFEIQKTIVHNQQSSTLRCQKRSLLDQDISSFTKNYNLAVLLNQYNNDVTYDCSKLQNEASYNVLVALQNMPTKGEAYILVNNHVLYSIEHKPANVN